MARSNARSKKKKGITVDMSGVEGGLRSISDGWAHGVVKKAEETESQAGDPMFKLTWDVRRGKERATVFDNLVVLPQVLWKFKTLLEAAGVEVPDGEMDLDESTFEGLECEVEIVNEEYEGKERPKIAGYRPANLDDDEDDSDDDEEEEEEEKSSRKSKAQRKSKADDDEEEEEEEESEDEDEDEDEGDDEEEESDDEEDEEDEEEEEEEVPLPKKGKKAKASPGKAATKSKGQSKWRVGNRVSFSDPKGKIQKGVITSIDGDTITVTDKNDNEWELDESELSA